MLTEHLVRCETASVDINTAWYKTCTERLQQIFLMVTHTHTHHYRTTTVYLYWGCEYLLLWWSNNLRTLRTDNKLFWHSRRQPWITGHKQGHKLLTSSVRHFFDTKWVWLWFMQIQGEMLKGVQELLTGGVIRSWWKKRWSTHSLSDTIVPRKIGLGFILLIK